MRTLYEEKTPSFKVDPNSGYWHCYGACANGGDVISFVMETERLSFMEAVEKLADEAGMALPKATPESQEQYYDRYKHTYQIWHVKLLFCTGRARRGFPSLRGASPAPVERILRRGNPWQYTTSAGKRNVFSSARGEARSKNSTHLRKPQLPRPIRPLPGAT